jgi:hypothetical protein
MTFCPEQSGYALEQDAQCLFGGCVIVGTSITFAEIVVAMFAPVSLFASHDAAFDELLTLTTFAR